MNRIIMTLAAAALLLSGAAEAQQPRGACGDTDAIVRGLEDKFGETLQFKALDRGNRLVRVFANPGTWTYLVTPPEGPSCILATGDVFILTPSGEAQVSGDPA